ncbi:Asp23/Gls24 family envelope stress response protein [Thermomicrobiaceae bacterium CFH 74404]|uniref:Asp23/Gls24 family envelope stress response protein n=1 Tax=Thermalbibacter longus TaxID=2951981 RepID=A0AA41WB28_9BACT|nr:Asp23/Gls24 family envelope stress response protein [Thermalbibacter longus]MCM8749674.1 Asp23/Gls24 family envelope stress response protein [Thermalbibacter longus]
MAETRQNVAETRPQETAPARATDLVTEHGRTTIADDVVAKIAAIAAREVPGVHELVSQGVGGTLSGLTQRVAGGGGDNIGTQGVSVEVGQREAAVDLRMIVDYGVSIPQVADAVRRNIRNRVNSMTGLTVREVNIDVTDLYFAQQQQQTDTRVQ